jgi:hypothetical protein
MGVRLAGGGTDAADADDRSLDDEIREVGCLIENRKVRKIH